MSEWRRPDRALSERLNESRRWFQSEGRRGGPLVAHHEDLSCLDLAEQTLVEAQLQGADLRGARLDSARLVRAQLDGADLTGASLYQADLAKASVVRALLDHISARRSRWQRADLSGSSLIGADLTECEAMGLQAIGSNFIGAIFRDADLSGASLLASRLDDADLSRARVEHLVISVGALAHALGVNTIIGERIEFPADDQTERMSAISGKMPGPAMSAHQYPLAKELDETARSIDPSRVSVSKWNPVRDLLAEAIGVDPTDVYVATVSKAGNYGVRFGQSRGAREADIAVAMYPDSDPVELDRILRSAEMRLSEEDRRFVLVFAFQRSQWSLRALLKSRAEPVPAAVAAAWPAATVVNV